VGADFEEAAGFVEFGEFAEAGDALVQVGQASLKW
jgi:hypothetical protein